MHFFCLSIFPWFLPRITPTLPLNKSVAGPVPPARPSRHNRSLTSLIDFLPQLSTNASFGHIASPLLPGAARSLCFLNFFECVYKSSRSLCSGRVFQPPKARATILEILSPINRRHRTVRCVPLLFRPFCALNQAGAQFEAQSGIFGRALISF